MPGFLLALVEETEKNLRPLSLIYKSVIFINGILLIPFFDYRIKSLGSNSHSMKMEVRNTEAGSVFQYITDFWLSNEDDDKFVQLLKIAKNRLLCK